LEGSGRGIIYVLLRHLAERLSKTTEIRVGTVAVPTEQEYVYPYTNLLGLRKERRRDIRSVEEKRNRECKKDQENE
jgi:hypothetical protein